MTKPAKCALPGCPNPVRIGVNGKPTLYCSPLHSSRGLALKQAQWARRGSTGSAENHQRRLGERADSRELRQQPAPPPYRLTVNPAVKFGPPIPAPVSRDARGRPLPFQDDMRAVLDHGSPGRFSAPAVGQARMSPLGAIAGGVA